MKIPTRFKTLLRPDSQLLSFCETQLDKLSLHYQVEIVGEIKDLKFFLINSKINPSNPFSFKIMSENGGTIELLFNKYTYKFHTAHQSGGKTHLETNLYTSVLLKLNEDYGITLFRPETWEDKVLEIFTNKEIKFENRKLLNKKYYIQSTTEYYTKTSLPKEFLDYIENIDDLSIEFQNDICLLCFSRIINERDIFTLCEIGLNLSKILN